MVGRFLAYNDIIERRKASITTLQGYDFRNIQFDSQTGITLRGWFIKSPNNDNGKTLFLLHGWLSNRETIIEHAKMYVDSGFHVIMYDQRSHGESDNGLVTYGELEGWDLLSAIEYSKAIPEVNQSNRGAVAFSLGTGSIIYAQVFSGDNAFKCAILEGAFATSFDVGDKILIDKFGFIGGKFVGYSIFTVGTKFWSLGKFNHSETALKVAEIKNLPLMIIRGINDSLVPQKSFERFCDSINTTIELWLTDNSNHTKSFFVYPSEYRSNTVSFLKKYLK